MNIVYYSKLSPEECIRRFKENTRKSILGSSSLTSLVTFMDFEKKYIFSNKDNSFKLERVFVRNIHRPIFLGNLSEIRSGTKVEGKIITHWSAKAFEVVWFTLASIIGVLMIATSIKDLFYKNVKTPDTFVLIIVPILLIIFGYLVTKAMKQQAEEWRKEMILFIEKTIEAEQT